MTERQRPLPGGSLAGTPHCETCGKPAQGIDTYAVPAASRKGGTRNHRVRKKYACRGEGCHRGSFVAFPWVYAAKDGNHAV